MNRRPTCFVVLWAALNLCLLNDAGAQSLGNAGTIQGSVTDPSGASVPGATVTIANAVTGYTQTVTSGESGSYRLVNIPRNSYHVRVSAPGFAPSSGDVSISSSLPVEYTAKLTLASAGTTVNVESDGQDLVETSTSDHIDVDRSQMLKIPSFDPGGGLSQAITYSTGGVAAGENGFFHPLGDHAQVSFVIDGQPISDQQSKVFSTQLPTSAIQSMELITGSPQAEFGDKSSLVDEITTRSGLGAMRTFGSIDASYGSFGNVVGDVGLGFGNEKVGNFVALDGSRSGRFLDTPEFTPFHDKGNNETIFDRFDWQPTSRDAIHLNLFGARNWIQIPNSYDQLAQDQRQRVLTWSIAPGFQHTFNAHYLLTVNPYIRKDEFNYFPSRNPLLDAPTTQSQHRKLFNYGLRSDLAISQGRHNIKIGVDLKQTRLFEEFAFGLTTPLGLVLPCPPPPADGPQVTGAPSCEADAAGRNPGPPPGLVPFDLASGGSIFRFKATHNINQYSAYIQDGITLGNFLLTLGLRGDTYYGLVQDSGASPRVGLAYNIKNTKTVLRVAYSHSFETPFNENLLLSSASGVSNGVADSVLGASATPPIPVGKRNQYNTGFQQAIGRYILVDADYFLKLTDNAYDFSALQNTTITFPIAWKKSKIDGVTGKVSTTNIHGFQTYWTFGHTRARYFPDQTGGLLNTENVPPSVFRIDHDQEFQSTILGRYQRPHNAEWISVSWRFDSGMVAGLPDVNAALGLTPSEQVTIGFTCNGIAATYSAPITSCNGTGTSSLLTLPQSGKENDDHNPDRVKPRNTFNIGIGTDNLLHVEGERRLVASLQVENLTNERALFNFLSTFSGTHFLQPRTIVGSVGVRF